MTHQLEWKTGHAMNFNFVHRMAQATDGYYSDAWMFRYLEGLVERYICGFLTLSEFADQFSVVRLADLHYRLRLAECDEPLAAMQQVLEDFPHTAGPDPVTANRPAGAAG